MSTPEAAAAIHALGFSAGVILYGMLLVMVARVRPSAPRGLLPSGRSAMTRADRLLLATSVAGLLWNAGALWIYGLRDFGAGAPAFLQVISFSALGFLPAIAVHAVVRREPGTRLAPSERLLTASGYTLSVAATALHGWAAWTGAAVPSVAGLRLLMVGFLVLMAPLAVMTRGQAGARRMLWVLAFAVFAVSALHLSEHHLQDRWFIELAGHHGSLLLAFAVLYQDYPFTLADLFLKRALAAFVLLLLVLGLWSIVQPWAVGPSANPVGPALLLGVWISTVLVFPIVQRMISRVVDRLLLRAFDYPNTLGLLAQEVGALADEGPVLDATCRILGPALSALHVTWRVSSGEIAVPDAALTLVDPRRLSATVAVPTTEAPRYELDVAEVAGGRRLLSDEVALLEHVGHLVARRLDAIRLERERFEGQLREEEISRLAAEARLEALRAQINPHFLFNALTTIGYLVQTAPAQALRTLLRLTEVLRHVLRSDERVASLDQELGLVRAYLEIEQARFEERLEVSIDLPDDLLDALVPPLILQPLVENAVKHGVSPYAAGGRVTVSGCRVVGPDGRPALELTVEDSAHGHERAAQTIESGGIGLANIERRLALAYGPRASVTLETGLRGAVAQVRLPLEIASSRTRPTTEGATR